MRIYKFGEDVRAPGDARGLITNRFGSYFCVDPTQSYQGWHVLETNPWRMQKVIETLAPQQEIKDITLFPNGFHRHYDQGQDTLTMFSNMLCYETHDLQEDIILTLDHRESYEQSRMGRTYTIKEEHDSIVITFTQEGEYERFLVIKGIQEHSIIDSWKESYYSFNDSRGTPSTYWVYDALRFKPQPRMVFASGKTLHEAHTLARIGYAHFDDIQHSRMRTLPFVTTTIEDRRTALAHTLACYSLHGLTPIVGFDHTYTKGIFAGFPWFFQIWSRDELISLGGLLVLAKQDRSLESTVKTILDRHAKNILPNGQLSNRFPHSELGSVDAFGWLAIRTIEFLTRLNEEKRLFDVYTVEELTGLFEQFTTGLAGAKTRNGMYPNEFNETWMDTAYHDDGRVGFRIEIQALYFAVHKAIHLLAQLLEHPDLRSIDQQMQGLREIIRVYLFKNKQLLDGLNDQAMPDKTIRPNVFLAAYVGQELLTNNEWEQVFSDHLEKLWLEWGGLSTIPKDHSLFQPQSTGQNNMSYHRGDSWHFVNNIAATVMNRINKKKFQPYIDKIIQADVKDILELGWAGHMSEISSAITQDANGCMGQAWSVGTFIQLLDEYY